MATTTKNLTDTGCTSPTGVHADRNGTCTRCGAATTAEATPSPEQTAKFELILKAEDEVRVAHATAAMGMTFADRTRGAQELPKRREALYALIDALTMDEMAAYGEYRKAQLAADAA